MACKIINIIKTIKLKMVGKKKNIHISLKSNIGDDVRLEGDNYIGEDTFLEHCNIGKMTYIANNCNFVNTSFGKYCSIGPECRVIFGDHPTNTFVSTHPAFYSFQRPAGKCYVSTNKFDEIRYFDEKNGIYVEIGNDVWLATNVTILSGVKIGDGAIIGAGSIVCNDIPPYAIASGVPAKVKKYRFNTEQINILSKYKWWNRSEKWIVNNAELFDDIDKLLNVLIQEDNSE